MPIQESLARTLLWGLGRRLLVVVVALLPLWLLVWLVTWPVKGA